MVWHSVHTAHTRTPHSGGGNAAEGAAAAWRRAAGEVPPRGMGQLMGPEKKKKKKRCSVFIKKSGNDWSKTCCCSTSGMAGVPRSKKGRSPRWGQPLETTPVEVSFSEARVGMDMMKAQECNREARAGQTSACAKNRQG